MREGNRTILGLAVAVALLLAALAWTGPAWGGFVRDLGEVRVAPTSCGAIGSASDGKVGCPTPVGTPVPVTQATGSAGTNGVPKANADHSHAMMPLLLFSQTTDGTDVTNTTTETSIIGTGTGSLTIPSSLINTVGRTFRLTIAGTLKVDQANDSADFNQTVKVKLGGTTILSRGPSVLSSGGTANPGWFQVVAIFSVRSTGSSGTVWTQGHYQMDVGAFQLGPTWWYLQGTAQPVTVNLTTDPAVDVTFTWAEAATDNSIRSRLVTLEVLP